MQRILLVQLLMIWRQIRRARGYSLAVILTLAVGIAASTVVFSLLNAVVLRPLPYPEPNHIVWAAPVSQEGAVTRIEDLSYPDFFDWRKQSRSFSALASYHTSTETLGAASRRAATQQRAAIVSADFFNVLGTAPLLGRAFTRAEERPGNDVVILSHDLWAEQFASDPAIVGRTVKLDSRPFTVIGIMPKGFAFPIEASVPTLWLTPAVDASGNGGHPSTEQRGWTQLDVIGRLKPGVTARAAEEELSAIQRGLSTRYPESDAAMTSATAEPELQHLVGDVRPAMTLLAAAVTVLMLIACANVAGLQLARGQRRQAEFALRSALGASRWRIARELTGESVLLSLAAGATGLALATLALNVVVKLLPPALPRAQAVSIDRAVVLFSFGASLVTGVISALLPAFRVSRVAPNSFLQAGGRGVAGHGREAIHRWLTAAETALGVILLIGAGLMMRSFVGTIHTDAGFNPRHILTFSLGIPEAKYSAAQRAALNRQILERLKSLPGVSAATASFPLSLSGATMSLSFQIEGHPVAVGHEPDAAMSYVEPNYQRTLEIPLLRGRAFTDADNTTTAPPVVLINQTLARRYFPGVDPIGRKIHFGSDSDGDPYSTIVGVTGDVHRSRLTETVQPEITVPYGADPIAPASFALRVSGDPDRFAKSVEQVVRSIDPEIPVYRIGTYAWLMNRTVAEPRFETLIVTGFAALAALLAAIGLYAVLSYTVAQRNFEISLRMAIGARRGEILKMILLRGLQLSSLGLAIGLAVSAVLTRYLHHLLYRVNALDPATFLAVAALMIVVSMVASFAPAWRAAQRDPAEALRDH